jgi:hypothetical protein
VSNLIVLHTLRDGNRKHAREKRGRQADTHREGEREGERERERERERESAYLASSFKYAPLPSGVVGAWQHDIVYSELVGGSIPRAAHVTEIFSRNINFPVKKIMVHRVNHLLKLGFTENARQVNKPAS